MTLLVGRSGDRGALSLGPSLTIAEADAAQFAGTPNASNDLIAAINSVFGHQLNDPLGLSVTADFTSNGYCSLGRLLGAIQRLSRMTSTNLISDLERALTARSAEAGAMLHKLTEVFLVNVGHYSADQLDLYDGVFDELVKKVEVAARADCSATCVDRRRPAKTIRSLALDDAIEVAEPVLSQSNALDDAA